MIIVFYFIFNFALFLREFFMKVNFFLVKRFDVRGNTAFVLCLLVTVSYFTSGHEKNEELARSNGNVTAS